jgi:hypothetical protein
MTFPIDDAGSARSDPAATRRVPPRHAAGRPAATGRRTAGLATAVALVVAVVVAACGGSDGSGSAGPPPPPETTEYSAQTASALTFTAGTSGTGTAPLRFELGSAPDGMTIDPGTGAVAWVPQADQIGAHAVTVAVTDAGGATTTKTYRVQVGTAPGSPAYLVLRTDAPAYAPGQAIRVAWQLGGDLPANASIELNAYAPAADPAAPDGAPTVWALAADGSWSADPVALQAAAPAGQASLTLPNRLGGEWLIVVRLRDAAGAAASSAARRVLVAQAPSLSLSVNRTVANPLDGVKAEVALAGGATPLPTRLAAWMVRPDGRVVGLPSQVPGDLEVRRGESESGRYPLLDQAFADDETGTYRVHARLYAAADGRLLHEATAKIEVCSATSPAAGRVLRPDRAPLDGPAARFASVQAFDLGDGAVTAAAAVSSQGRYELSLPAGRYLLQARVMDAAGAELRADSSVLQVGCSATALAQDLVLQSR